MVHSCIYHQQGEPFIKCNTINHHTTSTSKGRLEEKRFFFLLFSDASRQSKTLSFEMVHWVILVQSVKAPFDCLAKGLIVDVSLLYCLVPQLEFLRAHDVERRFLGSVCHSRKKPSMAFLLLQLPTFTVGMIFFGCSHCTKRFSSRKLLCSL